MNKQICDRFKSKQHRILADPHEEQASQSSVKVIAARSKAEAKPQKREPDVPSIMPRISGLTLSHHNPLSPTLEEIHQSSATQSNSTTEENGTIQSGELNFIFDQFSQVQPHWSDERW